MRYPTILAAALTAAALGAPAAAAAETFASVTVAVRYSDLDLGTRAGEEQLERRIDAVARAACGTDEVRLGTRMRSTEGRRCYEQTKETVRDQVAKLLGRDNARG